MDILWAAHLTKPEKDALSCTCPPVDGKMLRCQSLITSEALASKVQMSGSYANPRASVLRGLELRIVCSGGQSAKLGVFSCLPLCH